jgi:hypothetical protein
MAVYVNDDASYTLPGTLPGRFIAAIEIPNDGRITYERTGTNEGHYTLWGDPDTLLNQVIAVEPVRIVQEE